MRFFDAHSHIHVGEFDADREEVLSRMRASQVSTITVGTYLESSRKAIELAEKEENVWASVGLHPTDTDEDFDFDEYEKLALNKKVVAIGECGLDYFWQKEAPERKKQRDNFRRQTELALSVGKPLMIHSRPSRGSMDAYEDLLKIIETELGEHSGKLRGNVHFFVGDRNIARRFLDLGFTMSFTGVITFTGDYDEVIKYIPLESILSETDCPYVAPVPYRGKRNEPAYVPEVVKRIAEIKEISFEKVSEVLYKNAERVFLSIT